MKSTDQKVVTIYKSKSFADIYAAQAALEREDILCFRANEFTAQTAPYLTGGIELQVVRDDVPEAVEILQNAGLLTAEVCKKSNYVRQSVIFLISLIAVLILYLWMKKKY